MTRKTLSKKEQTKHTPVETTTTTGMPITVYIDGSAATVWSSSSVLQIKKEILKSSKVYKTVYDFDLVSETGTVITRMHWATRGVTRLSTQRRTEQASSIEEKRELAFAPFMQLNPVTRTWESVVCEVIVQHLRSIVDMKSVESIQVAIDKSVSVKKKTKGFSDWTPTRQEIDDIANYMDNWLHVTRFDTVRKCGNNLVSMGLQDQRGYANGYCESLHGDKTACEVEVAVHRDTAIQRCVWDTIETRCYSTTQIERNIRADLHQGKNVEDAQELLVQHVKDSERMNRFMSYARAYNRRLETFPSRFFLPVAQLNSKLSQTLKRITADVVTSRDDKKSLLYSGVPIDLLYETFGPTTLQHLEDFLTIQTVEHEMAAFRQMVIIREEVLAYIRETVASSHLNVQLVDEFITQRMVQRVDPLSTTHKNTQAYVRRMFTDRQPQSLDELVDRFSTGDTGGEDSHQVSEPITTTTNGTDRTLPEEDDTYTETEDTDVYDDDVDTNDFLASLMGL